VATAMLGSLARGDRSASFAVWNKYKYSMFGDSKPDLYFQLLAAESTD
jgi:hypothetical protein